MKHSLLCLTVLLSGCSTVAGTFDNRLTCSLAGDKAYVASLYGPVSYATFPTLIILFPLITKFF